jgi:hypothetical protein
MGSDLVHLILIGYVPVLAVLFSYLPRGRALVLFTVAGVLFLPEAHYLPASEGAPRAIVLPGLCRTGKHAGTDRRMRGQARTVRRSALPRRTDSLTVP